MKNIAIFRIQLNQSRSRLRAKELAESFRKAALDPEIQAMSEGGFEDDLTPTQPPP